MTRKPLKLSRQIQRELDATPGNRVVVAAVVTVTRELADQYDQLGLAFEHGCIATRPAEPPPASCGLYARRNLDGWGEKRTDLAKVKRDISHWAPSWKSGSFHLVSREIDAFPVDYHPAKLLTLSAIVLEQLVDGALVRFRVDEPLEKQSSSFAADLTFNLRLLREAVGQAGVFDADMSDEDFAQIQHVDWELLPPGSAERVLSRLSARQPANAERLSVASERLRVLDRLGHDGFIVGTGKFARYFGVKFGDRLVALENLEYGNSLYLFERDWQQLTQLSRTELIRRRDPSVHRVPHLPGWQSAIRQLLRAR